MSDQPIGSVRVAADAQRELDEALERCESAGIVIWMRARARRLLSISHLRGYSRGHEEGYQAGQESALVKCAITSIANPAAAIRSGMERHDWTVKALAKHSGLDRGTVTAALHGTKTMTADTALRLGRVLAIDPRAMLIGQVDQQLAAAESKAVTGRHADRPVLIPRGPKSRRSAASRRAVAASGQEMPKGRQRARNRGAQA